MKTLTRIVFLCAVLTAFLCATAYAGGDGASVQVIGKPTVSGHGIGVNDLDGLEEIAVPVQVSSDAPTDITLFASFYDGNGKYVGMGAASASVDSETSFVIMPVENVVTGAETLKMTVTGADFRPLSVSGYSLTGGGGGSSSGGGPNTTKTYYLNAAANLVDENGFVVPGYLMTTEPTEDTDLSEAYPSSITLQTKSVSPFFEYYVIFTPKELAYPRIIQGPASGVARVPVTLKAAPDAVLYRIWTYSGSSVESNAPTVTMKSAFRRDAGGGGGGSSGGGGGSSGGTFTTFCYALMNASVTPTDAPHGKVFLMRTAPTTEWTVPAPANADDKQTTASVMFTATSNTGNASITGYAVFAPDEGYELDGAPTVSEGTITALNVELANGAKAFSFTTTGKASASMPTVTIEAAFKQSGGLDHENETPILSGAFG